MASALLDPAHKLLVALAVAARGRDPVLVAQIAERADLLLTPREMKRAFSRLPTYGVNQSDLDWLQSADL
jgi:hypothetical protein